MTEYTGARRLPGRTPRRARPEQLRPVPVQRVEIHGRLVGVEGNDPLEVLHVHLEGGAQLQAQLDMVTLIDQRVTITVELEGADGN